MPKPYSVELSVSNVAASKTAQADIPVGQRILGLIFQHGHAGTNTIAAAMSNITEIRVKVDGEVVRKISGTQLRDLNLGNGRRWDCRGLPGTSPGVSLPMFFAEPWRKDFEDQVAGALPTVWRHNGQEYSFKTVRVEVDLSSASTPTLVAWLLTDDVIPVLSTPRPMIVRYEVAQVTAAGTSYDVTTIDKSGHLAQATIYPDSGASREPSRVQLKKNGEVLHDLTRNANLAALVFAGMEPEPYVPTVGAAMSAITGGEAPTEAEHNAIITQINLLRADLLSLFAASGRTANLYDLVLDREDMLGYALDLASSRELLLKIQAAAAMSGAQDIVIQRIKQV